MAEAAPEVSCPICGRPMGTDRPEAADVAAALDQLPFLDEVLVYCYDLHAVSQ